MINSEMYKYKNDRNRLIYWKILLASISLFTVLLSFCYSWELTPLNILSQKTDKLLKYIDWIDFWASIKSNLYMNAYNNIQYSEIQPIFDSVKDVTKNLNLAFECDLQENDVTSILYFENRNFKKSLKTLSSDFIPPKKYEMQEWCEKLMKCILKEVYKAQTVQSISYCRETVDDYYQTLSSNKQQTKSVSETNKWSDTFRNNSLKDSSYDILNDVYELSKLLFDSPEKPSDVLFYDMPEWVDPQTNQGTNGWENEWWNGWGGNNWGNNWNNIDDEVPYTPYHTPEQPEWGEPEPTWLDWNDEDNINFIYWEEDLWSLLWWTPVTNDWSFDSYLWDNCVSWFDMSSYVLAGESYCWDWIIDEWEACDRNDPNHANWWDGWCSTSCRVVSVDAPICNNIYDGQRLAELSEQEILCTNWDLQNFMYSSMTHEWTWKCENTFWSRVDCLATQSYCWDWIIDEWEACDRNDPNHTNWWNRWCSDSCEVRTTWEPQCNPEYDGHEVENLTENFQLCSEWTSVWFEYNESTKKWTWRCENVLWSSVSCTAEKRESEPWNGGWDDWGDEGSRHIFDEETRSCLQKCDATTTCSATSCEKIVCYAKCLCQSVQRPKDRSWINENTTWFLRDYLNSTIWMWPMFKLEFCIQPVTSHKLETSKKVNNLEAMMTEIYNVLQDLKNSGQMLKNKKTKEYMEAWYSESAFSSISFSIFSTTRRPSSTKSDKVKADNAEEFNNTIKQSILWIEESDNDKYIIKWLTSTKTISTEKNISEMLEVLDTNRLMGMDSEFTEFLQTNVDFWITVHENLNDMKKVANALDQKK